MLIADCGCKVEVLDAGRDVVIRFCAIHAAAGASNASEVSPHDCSKNPCELCRRRMMPWPDSQCSPGCPGWAVFNGNEVQRCDACGRFADDDEAIEHVKNIEQQVIDATGCAEPDGKVYVCSDCGCIDVEGTAWIHLNTDALSDGDPPLDDYWCPRCESHSSRICLVNADTGECQFHKGHSIKPVREWAAEQNSGRQSSTKRNVE